MSNTHLSHRRSPTWIATTAAIAIVLATLSATPAIADNHSDPVYTRVALWQVERTDWAAFADFYTKYDQPILEKLYKDGLITEWGLDASSIHKPDGYTHSTWLSASSLGNLEKAMDAYMAAFKDMGPEKEAELDETFASMVTKHRDYILENDVFRSTSSKLDNGYFHGDFIKVKMNKGKAFKSYWKSRIQPVYEELLANGDIIAFGRSDEAIVTEEPGGVVLWYVTPTADGLDAVERAFEASWEEMDDEGQRARWTSIMDFVDEGSYRSFMSKILVYQVGAHE